MNQLALTLRSGRRTTRHGWELTSSGQIKEAKQPVFADTRLSLSPTKTGEWNWELKAAADSVWSSDVSAELNVACRPLRNATHVYWPLHHGVLERRRVTDAASGEFRSAGRPIKSLPPDRRLALPFVVLETPQGYWLVGTDPAFWTTLSVDAKRGVTLSWKWLADAGIHANESRRIFCQPVRDVRDALDRWFALATPDVPRGPDWLHEIALQDYDFLSQDGRGWFADIDAACKFIPRAERHRAIFCLHGWYGAVGDYGFDFGTNRFRDRWMATPYMRKREIQKMNSTRSIGTGIYPSPDAYVFRNLKKYRPVPMDWKNLRARLRYAKKRGLRTALYAMTGLQAPAAEPWLRDDAMTLSKNASIWIGPDAMGAQACLNPLHPAVRERYLAYVAAILEQAGDWIDALVMDEAYYVAVGSLGPKTCPGYPDRAQMSLIREMTALCHSYRRDLAFVTADLLGHPLLEQRYFPYSLFADGIYQDSSCWVQALDCLRFPAWRNTAWICNWAPVTNLGFTRWSVTAHQGTVAISNGCFGDDTGIASMPPSARDEIVRLWRLRTSRCHEKPVPVVEIR